MSDGVKLARKHRAAKRRRRKLEVALIVAAENWWVMRRPQGWTEFRHRLSPYVNCVSDDEKALGIAVAEYRTPPLRKARR